MRAEGLPVQRQPPMCTGPDADVIAAPPTGQVVAALVTGAGVVGDLIRLQTFCRHLRLCDFEHVGGDVFVGGVVSGSPADRAGLEKGDRLLEFNGVELNTWRDLMERIAASRAGDRVMLLVQRRSRGPRLVIAGRDIETVDDLQRLKKSLSPGATFEGMLTTEDTREIEVVLEESQ